MLEFTTFHWFFFPYFHAFYSTRRVTYVKETVLRNHFEFFCILRPLHCIHCKGAKYCTTASRSTAFTTGLAQLFLFSAPRNPIVRVLNYRNFVFYQTSCTFVRVFFYNTPLCARSARLEQIKKQSCRRGLGLLCDDDEVKKKKTQRRSRTYVNARVNIHPPTLL